MIIFAPRNRAVEEPSREPLQENGLTPRALYLMEQGMNIRHALVGAVGQLESSGVSSAQAAAEWTLAQVMQCQRFDLLADPTRVLTDEEERSFQRLLDRLARHEPLPYVLGTADFMGLTLNTDVRALIPRPETEQLVDRILRADLWGRSLPLRGVDVGTGSGCIVLALAQRHPEWQWVAVDREQASLDLARENARMLSLEAIIEWREGDLLESFEEESLDLVVSNPPYIATAVCDTLDRNVREYEPRTALDGGGDGLVLIRRLIEQAIRVLRHEGWIFLEIGHDQGHRVAFLLEQAGFSSVSIRRDLAGQDRMAEGKKV